MPQPRWRVALAAVLLLGLVGLALSFDPVGLEWDSAEYVWAVRADFLPHSPYLGYLLVAHLASLIAPAPIALSLLSAAACLASAALLSLVVRNLRVEPAVAVLAAFFFLAVPITLATGGEQEVYTLQASSLLLALWLLSAESPRVLAAGLAFAFAMSVHQGSIFTLPAFAFLLWRGGGGAPQALRRGIVFVVPNLLGGLATVAVAVHFFRDDPAPIPSALRYLRGIAPLPAAPDAARVLLGLERCLAALFAETTLGAPLLVACLVLAGMVSAFTRARALFWSCLLFAAGFLVYESVLGETVDPGAFVVYYVPPIAVFCACGVREIERAIAAASNRVRPRWARLAPCVRLAVLVAMTFAGARAVLASPRAQAVEQFRRHPYVLASRWIDEHLPRDAIVVQPLGIANVNLLPAIHLRRPIIVQDGSLFLMRPPRAGMPLNLSSYEALSADRLRRLVGEEGARMIALDGALQPLLPSGFALVPLPEAAGIGATLFEVRRSDG